MTRHLVTAALLVSALLLIGGGTWAFRDHQARNAAETATRDALHRIRQQISLHSTTESSPLSPRGYPLTIDPEWFGPSLPLNALVSPDRPWMEIASGVDLAREHPVELTTIDRTTAMFWYNPSLGVVRARAPLGGSDIAALKTYNTVNDAALTTLFAPD